MIIRFKVITREGIMLLCLLVFCLVFFAGIKV